MLGLLAPDRCLACRARSSPPWCAACATTLRWLPAGCRRCAAPRGGGHACWPTDAPLDATIAVFDYRGPVSAAVVTAKLRGARRGWSYLGALLAECIADRGTDADGVTWVTTPARRVRQRGYDHARLLAEAVASGLELPAVRTLEPLDDGTGHDHYGTTVSLPGTNLLLVDDVLTTGTTAWRAAAALRRAGAGRVELAVLARAGTHPLGIATRGR